MATSSRRQIGAAGNSEGRASWCSRYGLAPAPLVRSPLPTWPHRRMRTRDTDAIRRFAKSLAQRFDVVGLESLQIKTMTESARARGVADVERVRRLNRSIRRACWGTTQSAVGAAFEARGSRVLKLPAGDSSDTCAEDRHADPKSRKGKRFRCPEVRTHRRRRRERGARDAGASAARARATAERRDRRRRARRAAQGDRSSSEGEHEHDTGRAGAIAKPACAAPGTTTAVRVHPSTAPACAPERQRRLDVGRQSVSAPGKPACAERVRFRKGAISAARSGQM